MNSETLTTTEQSLFLHKETPRKEQIILVERSINLIYKIGEKINKTQKFSSHIDSNLIGNAILATSGFSFPRSFFVVSIENKDLTNNNRLIILSSILPFCQTVNNYLIRKYKSSYFQNKNHYPTAQEIKANVSFEGVVNTLLLQATVDETKIANYINDYLTDSSLTFNHL